MMPNYYNTRSAPKVSRREQHDDKLPNQTWEVQFTSLLGRHYDISPRLEEESASSWYCFDRGQQNDFQLSTSGLVVGNWRDRRTRLSLSFKSTQTQRTPL